MSRLGKRDGSGEVKEGMGSRMEVVESSRLEGGKEGVEGGDVDC